MYAAQLRFAMEKSLGELEPLLHAGQFEAIFTWLDRHIWSKDSLLTTDELMRQATGETLNGDYLQAPLILN